MGVNAEVYNAVLEARERLQSSHQLRRLLDQGIDVNPGDVGIMCRKMVDSVIRLTRASLTERVEGIQVLDVSVELENLVTTALRRIKGSSP